MPSCSDRLRGELKGFDVRICPVNEFLSVLAEQPGVVSIQTGEIDDTSE